jgi:ABC-type transport system substrate-binding protein
MHRRELLRAAALSAGALTPPLTAHSRDGKTLRLAFNTAEAGFDPPRVSDQSSLLVNAHIFEAPLTLDPLADPPLLVPQTAVALPEMSADAKHFVFTLKPGTFFADDPAFNGKVRELVAEDYVYSIKRYYDPQLKSEHLNHFETPKILGLSELRQRGLKNKTPFDYDTPVAGLRAIDRYRFEVRLAEPAPRLAYVFAQTGLAGAVAREVVQAYGEDIMAHPVGTGPFMLKQWRRASAVVLERNPRFREQRYAAAPPAADAALVALAARLRGQRLPLVDRIEISVIEETQPRWLAFLRGELDVLELPSDFAPMAMPGGQLAPFLAKRGVQARRTLSPTIGHTFFNFDDATVGGYGAAQVALRRAIGIAYDNAEENRHVYGDQHQLAQTMVPPGCWGHDAALRSELGSGQLARARALLDLYGYADRNGDGWRELPDGTPLVLRRAFVTDQRSRRQAELWQKRMAAIGLQLKAEIAPFGELIRRALAGQLMMWGFSWSAAAPDCDFFLGLAYGPNADQSNDARFKLPAFDRLYERQRVLPNGPERAALVQDAVKLMLAYVPYIPHVHSVTVDLVQPQVSGFVRHPFTSERWRSVSVGTVI